MIQLDANILLRAYTSSDDPRIQRLHTIASRLLQQADQGFVEITASDAVIAEVAFVLTARSHYGLPVAEASSLIAVFVQLRGFRSPDKVSLLTACELWARRPELGFVDALTAAQAIHRSNPLATFDSDIDAIEGLVRWNPENSSN